MYYAYSVSATFNMSGSKKSLINISICRIFDFLPDYSREYSFGLVKSRCFHSMEQAEEYINSLYETYPEYTAPRPKLWAEPLVLF